MDYMEGKMAPQSLSKSEASGWNVRTAEPGDTILVERPPDEYEKEMQVLNKTETKWTVTLLARPAEMAGVESVNPVEIKTVRMQSIGPGGKGLADDAPGGWHGPTLSRVGQSKIQDPHWVRVWDGDE